MKVGHGAQASPMVGRNHPAEPRPFAFQHGRPRRRQGEAEPPGLGPPRVRPHPLSRSLGIKRRGLSAPVVAVGGRLTNKRRTHCGLILR